MGIETFEALNPQNQVIFLPLLSSAYLPHLLLSSKLLLSLSLFLAYSFLTSYFPV